MITVEIETLTGPALHHTVATALGWTSSDKYCLYWYTGPAPKEGVMLKAAYQPTVYWAQAGNIIETNQISFTREASDAWRASIEDVNDELTTAVGPTHLIAAMRCFAISKLGTTIDLPESLCLS